MTAFGCARARVSDSDFILFPAHYRQSQERGFFIVNNKINAPPGGDKDVGCQREPNVARNKRAQDPASMHSKFRFGHLMRVEKAIVYVKPRPQHVGLLCKFFVMK